MYINRNDEEEIDPEKHPVVKFASKYFAVHPKFEGGKFFVRIDRKRLITPLLLVLLIIEVTDLVFAVDSIPAIFSVTKDPYIVFFSNIFAILGLRSMFFAIARLMKAFRFLHYGLAALLILVGLKMLAADYYRVPIGITLGVVAGVLLVSIAASVAFPAKNAK